MNHRCTDEGIFPHIKFGDTVVRTMPDRVAGDTSGDHVQFSSFLSNDDIVYSLDIIRCHKQAGLEREDIFTALLCDDRITAWLLLCNIPGVFILVLINKIPVIIPEPVIFFECFCCRKHLNSFICAGRVLHILICLEKSTTSVL